MKAYGDFRLKLQFREGRTEGYSNGGVFVRFPNPDGTAGARVLARSAAATRRWVAINCGHEIQLYDDETGDETRKTGSIYPFDDNNARPDRASPTQRGEWEDYEIEVVGQHYTIRRNGQS